MLLLTELGYQGTVFLPGDMEVLDEDLESLKDYCNRLGVSPDIKLNDDTPEVPQDLKLLNLCQNCICFFGF